MTKPDKQCSMPEPSRRASIWRRIAAAWVDVALIYAATVCILSLAQVFWIGMPIEPAFAVVAAGYGVILVWARGQTIGKGLLRVKVVSRYGERPTAWKAVLRELVGKWGLTVALLPAAGRVQLGDTWVPTVFDLVILIPIMLLFLLYYAIARHTWYDALSGTRVVRTLRPPDPIRRVEASLAVAVFVAAIAIKIGPLLLEGRIPSRLWIYQSARPLGVYTRFLNQAHASPEDYILGLFKDHDLVVLCERLHPETTQWDLIYRLISDPRFVDQVGHVFTEYGQSDEQAYLDRFLETPGLSDQQVTNHAIYLMRNNGPWAIWTNTNFYRYLIRLYHLNQGLPESRRIRHHFTDVPLDWNSITSPRDYRDFRRTLLSKRDSLMAQRVIDTVAGLQASPDSRRKALVIMNYRHAFRLLRDPIPTPPSRGPDGIWRVATHLNRLVLASPRRQPMSNCCEFLYQAFPGRVANVLLNTDIIFVPLQSGAWDAAFERTGNRPVGFDLDGTPFGRDCFDLYLLPGTRSDYRYQDVFTGYVFANPTADQRRENGIPGYFEGFEHEALRRARTVSDDHHQAIESAIARMAGLTESVESPVPSRQVQTAIELLLLVAACVGGPIGLVAGLVGRH